MYLSVLPKVLAIASCTPRDLANAYHDCLWARPACSLPNIAPRESIANALLGMPAVFSGCTHWWPLEELAAVVSSDVG
eukprot:8930072-Pyramimonas_sp.AAC.1